MNLRDCTVNEYAAPPPRLPCIKLAPRLDIAGAGQLPEALLTPVHLALLNSNRLRCTGNAAAVALPRFTRI